VAANPATGNEAKTNIKTRAEKKNRFIVPHNQLKKS
jgi:hypothetical protein